MPPWPITGLPKPGKLEVTATKPLANQHDLALAYSPGVAAACEAIAEDPGGGFAPDRPGQPGRRGHQRHRRPRSGRHRPARRQAGHGRQGGAVQEVRRHRRLRHRARRAATPDKLVDIVAALEPTFGGINLEDIKAPGMLRDRGNACASACPSRCSTTTSTAPRSSSGRRSTTACAWSDKDLGQGQADRPRARARPRSPASTFSSRSGSSARTSGSTDIAGVVYEGRAKRRWTPGRRATPSRPTRASWPR